MTDLLSLALEAARAGGRAILEHSGPSRPFQTKADASPVTEADLASHRAILSRLAAATPEVPVLSEESDGAADRRAWRTFWCVDPLDGTKEFVKGSGEFAVNVAYVEDGVPVLGVVHAPVQNVTYFAADGLAWKQTGDDPPVRIRTREARAGELAVVASRDHGTAAVAAFIARAEADGRVVEATAMGSSVKYGRIAEGAADLYPRFGPTSEWDTAAPQAILEAAGGGVSTLDGEPLRYNKADLLNPSIIAWGDAELAWPRWV